MNTYKTSTFLIGLFSKFHLQDKGVRKIISELYGNLIDSILKDVSEEKRILLFKSLIPVIRGTIDYFLNTKQNNIQVDDALLQVTVQLVSHCTYIIQEIGIKDNKSTQVFDNIMKQAFIADTACDIGECIRKYRKTSQATVKSDIQERLTVLLADYNVIMHTDLTPEGVLKKSTQDEQAGQDEQDEQAGQDEL